MMAAPEITSIPTSDRAELAAEVIEPSDDPKAVLLFVHGFAGDRYEGGLFSTIAEHALGHGVASVLYDWRGLGQSPGDFGSSHLGQHLADYRNVVTWVRERFSDQRLCVVGFSLGAFIMGMGFRAGVVPDHAVAISPALRPHQSMFPRYDTPDIRDHLRTQGCITKPGSDVVLRGPIINALQGDLGPNALSEVPVPIMVGHGTNDARVPYDHSVQLLKTGQFKAPLYFHTFPGASHSLRPAGTHWPTAANRITSWALG